MVYISYYVKSHGSIDVVVVALLLKRVAFPAIATRSSSFLMTAGPVSVLAHLFGITFTTLVLVWILHFGSGLALKSDNKEKIFNVHPVLMLIGFLFVAGEGIMAYQTVPSIRRVQKFIHMTFLFVALLIGILGVYAVFKFKHEVGQPSMRNLHTWLGMGTICLFGLQWLLSFFTFFFPGARSQTRARLAPWHWFFGLVIFLVAVCTAETGLLQRSLWLGLSNSKEAFIVNFTGIAVLLYGITVSLVLILPR